MTEQEIAKGIQKRVAEGPAPAPTRRAALGAFIADLLELSLLGRSINPDAFTPVLDGFVQKAISSLAALNISCFGPLSPTPEDLAFACVAEYGAYMAAPLVATTTPVAREGVHRDVIWHYLGLPSQWTERKGTLYCVWEDTPYGKYELAFRADKVTNDHAQT